ncbi:hypothetical protein Tco_1507453 [Tanacetum coccineum]
MNEKGIDSSKNEMVKEESKEEVKEENKEEESTRKRKLGTRKNMKSRKRRFIQNTSEDNSEKENDELRLHLTIALRREKRTNTLEEINQNVVIRSNGQKRYFSTLMRVLSIFDRDDLDVVYQLVMDRYQDEIPEGFDRRRSNPLTKESIVANVGIKVESKKQLHMALELIRFVKKLSLIETLLPFSSKNEDKVFNPGILPSNILSHRGKTTSDFSESPMMISRGDIPFLDVLFLHLYPL